MQCVQVFIGPGQYFLYTYRAKNPSKRKDISVLLPTGFDISFGLASPVHPLSSAAVEPLNGNVKLLKILRFWIVLCVVCGLFSPDGNGAGNPAIFTALHLFTKVTPCWEPTTGWRSSECLHGSADHPWGHSTCCSVLCQPIREAAHHESNTDRAPASSSQR